MAAARDRRPPVLGLTLVASEGVACGCRAIIVADGGSAEAIGELAVIFGRGNPVSLADAIKRALLEEFDWENYWQ